jgi:hypothetical protein
MIEDSQSRHEKLVDFLNKFGHYQTKDGKPVIQKRPKQLTSNKFQEIDEYDIYHAVNAMVDVLNLSGPVVSDVNLKKLLFAYFRIPASRSKINAAVNESISGVQVSK